MNKIKNILFVCKHNVFRSRIAEIFFNKFNKNKNYIARSAGLIPGKNLVNSQVEVAKKLGLDLNGKPQPITLDLLRNTDLMVVVADDVPPKIFDNKKYGRTEYVWKITDDKTGSPEEIYNIIKKIEKKIKSFVESLK